MNIYSISFASEAFRIQQRLQSKAFLDIGIASERIIELGPQDLRYDPFWKDFPWAREENCYGWFSFKPLVLREFLERINEGDILIYLDANDKPLHGLLEYVVNQFSRKSGVYVIAPTTNYPNIKYMSRYHHQVLGHELQALSLIKMQPEAGAIVIKNSSYAKKVMDAWYTLNWFNAQAMNEKGETNGRRDQETLYLVSRMCKYLHLESWFFHKLTGHGIRKYISFEAFRSV